MEERKSDYSKSEYRQQRRDRHRQQQESKDKMRWEHHAQRYKQNCANRHQSKKSWLGILIILIGVIWLLKANGVAIPDWLFSWPMLWIGIGVFTGLASRFRNGVSAILILVGLIFLLRNFIYPEIDLDKFLWPGLVIIVGILFLIKRHGMGRRREWLMQNHPELRDWRHQWDQQSATNVQPVETESPQQATEDNQLKNTFKENDWLDVTNIFGGTRRNVISKNFNGGDITNCCGGTEIDLTRADIQGNAVVDILCVLGGINIAVPPNWQVHFNLTNIMAGTDDNRRMQAVPPDPNKILTLNGTLFMGGIEVRDTL